MSLCLRRRKRRQWARALWKSINQCVVMNMQAQYTSPVDVSAITSWESAREDMGDYVEVISTEAEFDGEDGVIDVRVKGSLREAIVEIVL